jgi:serine/threonine protein kinase
MGEIRKAYKAAYRKRIRKAKLKYVQVHDDLIAQSLPVADPSHDVVDEQTRIQPITAEVGENLRKPLNKPQAYVDHDAQAGPAKGNLGGQASPPLNRRALLMMHNAQKLRQARSPEDHQPQPAPISESVKKLSTFSLGERKLIQLRKEAKPKLDTTAENFSITKIPFTALKNLLHLTNGGYGRVFTARWNDKYVVIKKFKGIDAEKNASRELGQVKLGSDSSYVVAVIGITWWPSESGRSTPCLVYPYEGNTLWDTIKDQESHPLVEPLRACAEICNAVHSLHIDSGMLHLDLKGDNVLIRRKEKTGQYRVHLVDMGCSQLMKYNLNQYLEQFRLKASEKHWYAPEWNHDTHLTPSADVWSLGYLLVDCLIPKGKGEYHSVPPSAGPIASKYNTKIEELVLACFNTTPRFRPSIPRLKTAFI